jgi:putative transcriptional regulator
MENRLEELRSQKGWTQQELADRVEVSRQTIISLEKGRYNPSILLAFKLARLFGVPVEELFLDNEEADHA